MGILELNGVNAFYDENVILKDINLSINQGEMVAILGPSGSGKSTLLETIMGKRAPFRKVSGRIVFDGVDVSKILPETMSQGIGYIGQDSEAFVVTDRVYHEIAFGLENVGQSPEIIGRKVAEISAYFGISDILNEPTNKLSSGKLRVVLLASVLAMEPKILLFDEPVANLDPIATREFFELIKRINLELGITCIFTEHDLNDIYSFTNRVILLDKGEIFYDGNPRNISLEHEDYLTDSTLIYKALSGSGKVPYTANEGKIFLEEFSRGKNIYQLEKPKYQFDTPLVEVKNLYFSYGKKEIISDANFTLYKGEIKGLLGGNGVGKTSFLEVLQGIKKTKSKIKKENSYYVPCDTSVCYLEDTVRECLGENERQLDIIKRFDIEDILDRNPNDLSGGEKKLVAFVMAYQNNPKVYLLDEITNGIDKRRRKILGEVLREEAARGKAIILSGHDLDFVARFCHTATMLDNKCFFESDNVHEFFINNIFYTTQVNRICSKVSKEPIIVEDVPKIFEGNEVYKPKTNEYKTLNPISETKQKGLKILKYTTPLIMAITIILGITVLENKKYIFIALLLVLEAFIPFLLTFEEKKYSTRHLVVISGLASFAVASRIVFYAFPECKPVLAIVMLSGICLGATDGFIVGALSMLLSNIFFGQGPWTPWQMVAMGLCGALAAVILKNAKSYLVGIVGIIFAVVLYGGIVNLASISLEGLAYEKEIIIAYISNAFLLDLLHGIFTFLIIILLYKPFITKVNRVANVFEKQ